MGAVAPPHTRLRLVKSEWGGLANLSSEICAPAEKAKQLLKAGFLKKAEAPCFQFPKKQIFKKQALFRPTFQISNETANIE